MKIDPAFRPLKFQALVGCAWVDCLPQHVRKGAIFRMLKADDTLYLAAAKSLPHIQDAGIYQASAHGTTDGVPFEAVQEVVELIAPLICPEG